MTDHVVEAVPPGFVGIAANIDAFDKLHLSGPRILHVKVDIEDEVAHLLHGSPRRPIRPGPGRKVTLAAIAAAYGRTGLNFRLHVGGDGNDLESARGIKPFVKEIVEHFEPLHLGGGRLLERRVDQREA